MSKSTSDKEAQAKENSVREISKTRPLMAGFLLEMKMDGLKSALGLNADLYESVALKVVVLIKDEGVSLEHGVIALKTAQLILEAQKQESWDTVLNNLALQPVV